MFIIWKTDYFQFCDLHISSAGKHVRFIKTIRCHFIEVLTINIKFKEAQQIMFIYISLILLNLKLIHLYYI